MLSLFRPRLVAVTLRATRLSSSMSSSSSSPSPLLLPSHIALIINRTLDKHHRSTYHLLERERVHYRASGSKLAPSIVHLLVLIEKLESDHLHHVKLEPYHNVHKRKNSVNYIEPLIFHAILSLYLLQSGASLLNPVGNAGAFPRDIALIQHDQLRSIVDQYNGARPKNQIVASDALTLSNMPVSADSRCSEHVANLSIAISLILQIFPNYSLANDIVPWIQTIAAPSVTQSCHALSNMTDIPPFSSWISLLEPR